MVVVIAFSTLKNEKQEKEEEKRQGHLQLPVDHNEDDEEDGDYTKTIIK